MMNLPSLRLIHPLFQFAGAVLTLLGDGMRFLVRCLRSPAALAAEHLFLRQQLALYRERTVKPRRATKATRFAMVWLGRWFVWRHVLSIVQPATLAHWHRQGFRWFWRWKSRPGRPSIPAKLQAFIRRMARDTPSWNEERIANARVLKLGLRVSPRTVRKDLPTRLNHGRRQRTASQRWLTFVRNHAQAIVACDFCVVVTATLGPLL
jgi:putative transposase